jgi:predicted O-methyltransferase YrrM
MDIVRNGDIDLVSWLLVLLGAIVAVGAWLDWRIRREATLVRRELVRRTDSTYDQLAALQGLYLELGVDRALPVSRGWAASPDFLVRVRERVLRRRPRVAVECGSGISTIVTALTLREVGGGHVWSLEHSPEHARATRAELEKHGVAGFATVLDAPLESHTIDGQAWTWYATDGLPERAIDMLVIDGPPKRTGKLARWPAGPLLFPRLSPGAVVLLDDAARPDEQEAVRRWRAAHADLAHADLWCEKGCVELVKPGNPGGSTPADRPSGDRA